MANTLTTAQEVMESVAELANRHATWLFDARQVLANNSAKSFAWSLAAAKTGTAVATNKITSTAHTLTAGQKVALFPTVTGGLPAPLTPGTDYYLVAVTANDFSVALTRGGAVVTITGSLNGNITIQPLPDYFTLDAAGNLSGKAVSPGEVSNAIGTLDNLVKAATNDPTFSQGDHLGNLNKLARPLG